MVDANHGSTPELLRAINAAGIAYRTLRECGLERNTQDGPLLRAIGKRGYLFLTADKSIRRNPLEFLAGTEAKVGQFAFTNNNMNGGDLASAFATASRALIYLAETEERPFIASIGKKGDVRLLYDHKGPVQGRTVRVIVPRAMKSSRGS